LSRSPTALPAVSSLLNGSASAGGASDIPYQQLAIVSAPLVICAEEVGGGVSSIGRKSSKQQQSLQHLQQQQSLQQQQHAIYQQQHHHSQHHPHHQLLYPANITAHTALAYAPPTAGGAYADGSPLLSFSEVTNTLLNQ